MTDPLTLESALRIAQQDSPHPAVAAMALRFLRDRYEALEIIALCVAGALERHGVTDVDNPGDAIDALVAAAKQSAHATPPLLPMYESAADRFPTMLRKMWSGGEVRDWLIKNAAVVPATAAAGSGDLGAPNRREANPT